MVNNEPTCYGFLLALVAIISGTRRYRVLHRDEQSSQCKTDGLRILAIIEVGVFMSVRCIIAVFFSLLEVITQGGELRYWAAPLLLSEDSCWRWWDVLIF